MTSAKAERDSHINQIMRELAEAASRGAFSLDPQVLDDIRTVASSKALGFREMVLVISVGKILSPPYDPTESLYAINPRAIYEGPIRTALAALGIRHGKSGPLNVAKAARGLTPEWAAQRRPVYVAQAVTRLADQIAVGTESEARAIGAALLNELLGEASTMAKLAVEAGDDTSVGRLLGLFKAISEQATDAGNTTQRIIGLIYIESHRDWDSSISVQGALDRASTTNTTSKKPGDILELSGSDIPLTITEITTKPFDAQRIVDSIAAVREYLAGRALAPVVTVICRPEDVPHSAAGSIKDAGFLGHLTQSGVRFDFVDIWSWIAISLARLSEQARTRLIAEFNAYVSEPNTAVEVKRAWRDLIESGY